MAKHIERILIIIFYTFDKIPKEIYEKLGTWRSVAL